MERTKAPLHEWQDAVATDHFSDSTISNETERMRVPGGWIYRSIAFDRSGSDQATTMAMVFVPKPPTRRRR